MEEDLDSPDEDDSGGWETWWLTKPALEVHLGLVVVLTLVNALPYWLGMYVPMVMAYSLYPAFAMFGAHAAAANDYVNWKTVHPLYLGLDLVFSILSLAVLGFYLAEWFHTPKDESGNSCLNGDYKASILGGEYPPLWVSTASDNATDAWWIVNCVVAFLLLFMSVLHLLAAAQILAKNKVHCCRSGQRVHTVAKSGDLPRAVLYKSPPHPIAWALQNVGLACLVLLAATVVLSMLALGQSLVVLNQDQNVGALFYYLVFASTCLPLSSLYRSKAAKYAPVDGKVFVVDTGREYDVFLEIYYATCPVKGMGDQIGPARMWNQAVVLIVGEMPGRRYAHIVSLLVFALLYLAYAVTNLVMQWIWIVSDNNNTGICTFMGSADTALTLSYDRLTNVTLTYTYNETTPSFTFVGMQTYTCVDFILTCVYAAVSIVLVALLGYYAYDAGPYFGAYTSLRSRLVDLKNGKGESIDAINERFKGRHIGEFMRGYAALVKESTKNNILELSLEKRDDYLTRIGEFGKQQKQTDLAKRTSRVAVARRGLGVPSYAI